MTKQEKLEILLATARAYYEREAYIQYDQRSMDRILQLTPRRRKLLPPEAATSQYIQFLDCSGFTTAVFYNAFGYELPYDLTWHMVDYLVPRIFFYEFSRTEGEAELDEIEKQLRDCLEPGDLVTFDRGVGSGHIMLYLGDGKYTDCTAGDGGDSYDFENRHNRFYERGIYIRDTELWFEHGGDKEINKHSLFNPKVRRISVSRPLDIVDAPTSDALARIGAAKKLVCSVLSSHHGGVHAALGEKVTYTVSVKNLSDTERDISISFTPPNGTEFLQSEKVAAKISANGSFDADFTVKVVSDENIFLEPPKIVVNTLNVYAPTVLLGKKLREGSVVKYISFTKQQIKEGKSPVLAATGKSEPDFIRSHFYLHDSPAGDVLSRRPQNPKMDMAVYSMFGGLGVITPQMATSTGIRCTHITKDDLIKGDIILCSDDPYGNKTYSCFYDGNELIGSFEFGQQAYSISGEQLHSFIDSLFGRFCFLQLRPYLSK